MQPLKVIDFIVLCSSEEKTKQLNFFLDRVNSLEKQASNIKRIRVFLVGLTEKTRYIYYKSFKKSCEDFKNIEVTPVSSARYATEPRAWNFGIYDSLTSGDSDYMIFLHDTDIILEDTLLSYYMWLFENAHKPELIGAVGLSTNTPTATPPPVVGKMWYVDDTLLRGMCYRTDVIKETGPFDESLLHRSYEFDYSSRVTHHSGYLVRLGKEPNKFIKLGKEIATKDYDRISFLKKQSLVWHVRKWHNKGVWSGHTKANPSCYINYGTFKKKNDVSSDSLGNAFVNLFKRDSKAQRERIIEIHKDKSIIAAIKISKGFVKKPFGNFTPSSIYDDLYIMSNSTIQTRVKTEMEYNDLLWDAYKKQE